MIIQLDPLTSGARVIRCRQNRGDATAFFQQIHFRAGRQINPTASPAAAKPRHGDQLTATAPGKECAFCTVEPDTGELKIEWFVAARIVIAGIRKITECDPRHQPTIAGLQVKLAPRRCAVSVRPGVIGARDFDRACNGRSAHRNQGRQKNRDSHVANLIDDARVRPVGHEFIKGQFPYRLLRGVPPTHGASRTRGRADYPPRP